MITTAIYIFQLGGDRCIACILIVEDFWEACCIDGSLQGKYSYIVLVLWKR